jgi:hypothetical protein
MAINTTTVETNLTTKLNATTGTTDAKEFLLLGKAVEALQPSVTVTSIQNEGATQVAAVQAAASGYAPLAGATFTGAIDMGSNNITTTGKILYSNVYSQLSDLPSASTYHGAFVHVHATGKAYYAHNSAWVPLVNSDANGDVTIDGSLTVNGTQTTINSTTLDVDDLNITVAKGAADAAAANGAGLTVDGASATFNYANSGDKWTMNKPLDVTGAVTATGADINGALSIEEVKEKLITDATTTGTYNFDAVNGAVVYFSGDMGANRTLNFRGDGSTTLDSLMTTGELMTFTLIAEQGGTGYYFNTITVDGYTPNKKWQGGSPPTSGNASSNDIYTITIQKFSASSWRIYASLTQYDN